MSAAIVLSLLLAAAPPPSPADYSREAQALEAEPAAGDHDPRTARVAKRLVGHSLAWGWDAATGQVFDRGYAVDPAFDKSLQWWEQFETVNVLALMHELHGGETPAYWDAFLKSWRFVRERLTDEEHRGVYLGFDDHGTLNTEKSGNWFASYHAARALMLTRERLLRLAGAPAAP